MIYQFPDHSDILPYTISGEPYAESMPKELASLLDKDVLPVIGRNC